MKFTKNQYAILESHFRKKLQKDTLTEAGPLSGTAKIGPKTNDAYEKTKKEIPMAQWLKIIGRKPHDTPGYKAVQIHQSPRGKWYMAYVKSDGDVDGQTEWALSKLQIQKLGLHESVNEARGDDLNGKFAVRWIEFGRDDRQVTKEKSFKSEDAMQKFIDSLEKKDNFKEIAAYSFDANESAKPILKEFTDWKEFPDAYFSSFSKYRKTLLAARQEFEYGRLFKAMKDAETAEWCKDAIGYSMQFLMRAIQVLDAPKEKMDQIANAPFKKLHEALTEAEDPERKSLRNEVLKIENELKSIRDAAKKISGSNLPTDKDKSRDLRKQIKDKMTKLEFAKEKLRQHRALVKNVKKTVADFSAKQKAEKSKS